MGKIKGFTLVELLVVIAIIALLMALLMPALERAREQGQRAVCLYNLDQLMLSYDFYKDDYEGSLVNGDTEEYTNEYVPGGVHYNETAWVLKDWSRANEPEKTIDEKEFAIKMGALYPYAMSMKVYSCPTLLAGHVRTYAISDAMNCIALSGCGPGTALLKHETDIHSPHRRFVFLDDGGTAGATLGGYTCYTNRWRWWDPPPIRHGDGTTLSFADGHVEYWKWRDPDTIECGLQREAFCPTWSSDDTGNVDIPKMQIAAWGVCVR